MAQFAIMTQTGRNKEAAALAGGTALTITEIAWGDGTRLPGGNETALENEQGRKAVQGNGTVNGALNTAFFEILLDVAEGPFTIREAGLFDTDGDLIAVAHYDPPVNKPKDTVSALLRIHVLFSDLQNLVLQVQGTDAYVPTERQIIAGTGLQGGGDLSQDRTLSLDAAAALAEIAGQLSSTHASSGVQPLVGGAILQWGSFVFDQTGNNLSKVVPLPMAFPTAHYQTILSDTVGRISPTGTPTEGARVETLTLANFTVHSAWTDAIEMPVATPCRFFSIGK
ncbi:phage tail-collar fiber domain-containing protein [Ruegeria arenilitoris]|uniref:phage tail-collar fiber domain-containing protein n=1 Tax=Ruegeria arenilitoris TaxID=1173585 RepID=UPI00147F221A|nr:phage tail protein [Ruegeria arenilitoris]